MLRLSDFDYELPPELIAQGPLADRSASRLLVLDRRTGELSHRFFRDSLDLLEPGDLLVMNDTRVTALRLFGYKPTGGEVEALLLKPVGPRRYEALMRPGKRLKIGARIEFDGLTATVVAELPEGRREIQFEAVAGLEERIREKGSVPLPPYIAGTIEDPERYQTVFARTGGSAAAPTAGLHFTSEMLGALQRKGVETATVTLDVGIDTFRPVQSEDLDGHKMHGERCEVPEETAQKIEKCKGRVIAVGTTSVRTLESLSLAKRRVATGSTVSTLFIRPGYEFKTVDGMFTNFHMPRTSMMIMLAAMVDHRFLMSAYRVAIQQNYRFLSFGDAMLVLPAPVRVTAP